MLIVASFRVAVDHAPSIRFYLIRSLRLVSKVVVSHSLTCLTRLLEGGRTSVYSQPFCWELLFPHGLQSTVWMDCYVEGLFFAPCGIAVEKLNVGHVWNTLEFTYIVFRFASYFFVYWFPRFLNRMCFSRDSG